jgi:hypothetical protein
MFMIYNWVGKAFRTASLARPFYLFARGFGGDKPFPSIDAFAKGKRLSPDSSGPVDLAELAKERNESAFATLPFPVPFKIKLIGVTDGKYQSDVLELVGEVVGATPSAINFESKLSGGDIETKYLSYSNQCRRLHTKSRLILEDPIGITLI